jgi:hypothetical protein
MSITFKQLCFHTVEVSQIQLYLFHNFAKYWSEKQWLILIDQKSNGPFFSFLVVLGRGTLWHLHRFLQCIKHIIYEFISSTILLHLPLLIPGVVSTGIIFAFTHVYTFFLHCICPPTPLPYTPPFQLLPTLPSGQNLFWFLVLWFCGRKKRKSKKQKHDILACLG